MGGSTFVQGIRPGAGFNTSDFVIETWGGGGYRRTRGFSNVRMTRSLNPESSENPFFLKLKPFIFQIGGKHFRAHATIAVHHLFCEALHFWSLRPLPETATERKTKRLPDGKSHGLGDIQQRKMQKRKKENLVPAILGQGDPPFRNRLSQKGATTDTSIVARVLRSLIITLFCVELLMRRKVFSKRKTACLSPSTSPLECILCFVIVSPDVYLGHGVVR